MSQNTELANSLVGNLKSLQLKIKSKGQIGEDLRKHVQKMINEISLYSNSQIWDEFEFFFNKTNPGFIKWLAETAKHSIYFMLWGTHAKKKEKLITVRYENRHVILKANHPSPLSANRGGWFGCGHFGETAYMIKW